MTRDSGRRATILASAANFALLGALAAPAVAVLPLRISALVGADQRTATLAAVVAAGAVAAVIANPVFGWLSDRTRGRWGRRAPWMVGGALLGAVGIALLTAASDIASIVGAWILIQTAYNSGLAAVAALFADALKERERAAASGLFAASTFLGTLPALVMIAVFPSFASTIAIVIGCAAVPAVVACAVLVRDRGSRTPGIDNGAPVPATPQARRDFGILWVQRLLMLFAFGLTTSFGLYYVLDRLAETETAAASLFSLTTLIGGAALVLASAVCGAWAGRRGGYLPFLVVAGLGLIAAAVVRAFAGAVPVLWGGALVGGFAIGMFFAVDLALALRVIPAGRSGQYLGLLNATETVPQVLTPLAAGLLVTWGGADPVSGGADNYATMHLAGAAVAVVALALLPLLGRASRRPEVGSSPERSARRVRSSPSDTRDQVPSTRSA